MPGRQQRKGRIRHFQTAGGSSVTIYEGWRKIKILKDEFSIVMERKFEEEVREMCDLSIGVAEWGMEQGIKEGICTAIKNLMSTTNWSAEQAMEALKIPEKEREAYAEQLREQTV